MEYKLNQINITISNELSNHSKGKNELGPIIHIGQRQKGLLEFEFITVWVSNSAVPSVEHYTVEQISKCV